MLIPLLMGEIQTAKSEVIVPALTEFQRAIEDDLVEYGNEEQGIGDRITQDLNCSAGNYYGPSMKGGFLVWACIDALSDAVGSSSGSSSGHSCFWNGGKS